MKERLLALFCILIFGAGSFILAQSDELIYDVTTRTLSLELSYDRTAVNAQVRDCPQEVFENGLLHSVLRHLFLYLPYEASFHPDVERLEVRVLRTSGEDSGAIALYAAAPLAEVRATNERFRVFMNSFASSRAGFCFAINRDSLDLWINTLVARQGQLAYDDTVFVLDLPQTDTLEDLQALAASSETSSQASAPAEPAQEVPLQPEPQEAQAAVTNNYILTPFLSELRQLGFASAEAVLDNSKDYAALIETTKGQIFVDLFETQAPITVNNFVFLALNHFYDGVAFHRVIDGFLAQTGDPGGTGLGGPGYQFADEFFPGFSHSTAGVVSMANSGPDTNGSQFFITFAPATFLDGQYAIFGAVTDGLEVLDELRRVDSSEPLALATLDTTLGLLETQGIDFAGADLLTLEQHLLDTLGVLPQDGLRMPVGEYDVIIGPDPQSDGKLVAFLPNADYIRNIYILERPKR